MIGMVLMLFFGLPPITRSLYPTQTNTLRSRRNKLALEQPDDLQRLQRMPDTPLSLRPQNILDLTDLFLNFAGSLFVFSCSFQIAIHDNFTGDLLVLTLYFVKLAFHLVPRARFHGISPLRFSLGYWCFICIMQGQVPCLVDRGLSRYEFS